MSDRSRVAELGRLIRDDGFAMSFQTMSKYRAALLNKVLELLESGEAAVARPKVPPKAPPRPPCRCCRHD
ncbi:hypothetical protein [Pseudomonas shirazica]|uniref:hypothetical protein n=1 Tax=Pseudomonas shirazica TaxID=1940636 RepID=UPI003AAB1D75